MKKILFRKNTNFSAKKLSNQLVNIDNILAQLNNSVFNPSGTAIHQETQAAPDIQMRSQRTVNRATTSKTNIFQLSQRQLMAQTASLLSKIGKRYL